MLRYFIYTYTYKYYLYIIISSSYLYIIIIIIIIIRNILLPSKENTDHIQVLKKNLVERVFLLLK